MGFSDHWKQYKSLRVQAFIGLLVAGYVARLPHDLSALSTAVIGRGLSPEHLSNCTWAMFPVAVAILGFTTMRWLWFSCPGCQNAFFGIGPDVAGKNLFVNPMASSCRHCDLPMGASVTQKELPTNVVPFDEIVRRRIEKMEQMRMRKEA